MRRWKPSKAQAREFAQRMQNDPEYAAAYNARKAAREEKRRASSQFNYNSAGGFYVPTRHQYEAAMQLLNGGLTVAATTSDEEDACNQVIYGYTCREKVHHDMIHIVNDLYRTHERRTAVD